MIGRALNDVASRVGGLFGPSSRGGDPAAGRVEPTVTASGGAGSGGSAATPTLSDAAAFAARAVEAARKATAGPAAAATPSPAKPAAVRARRISTRTKALALLLALFGVSALLRAQVVFESAQQEPAETEQTQSAAAGLGDPLAMLRDMSQRIFARDPAAAGGEGETEMALDTAAIETANIPEAGSVSELAEAALDAIEGDAGPATTDPLASGGYETSELDGEAAQLLAALRRREAELEAYAERLATREEELDAAARRLEERVAQLAAAREELGAMLATLDQAARRDVDHLIAMYERMRPQDAGPLFDAMAADLAAGFLGRMRADKAAAIMSRMQPDRAYAVTLALAGRNVRTPPAGQGGSGRGGSGQGGSGQGGSGQGGSGQGGGG